MMVPYGDPHRFMSIIGQSVKVKRNNFINSNSFQLDHTKVTDSDVKVAQGPSIFVVDVCKR